MRLGSKWWAGKSALQARLRGLGGLAGQVAGAARQVADDEHRRALDREAALRHSIDSASAADLQVARAMADAARAAAPTIDEAVRQLAPGLASMPPDAPAWGNPESVGGRTAEWVRVGHFDVPGEPALPVIAPLLGTSGWSVIADQAGSTHQLLRSVAVRLLAAAQPWLVRIDTYDPQLTGVMGVLRSVSSGHPDLLPRPIRTPADLRATVDGLIDVSAARAARLAETGFATFGAMMAAQGWTLDPYRVLLLLDYPAGIDEAMQQDLLRLVRTGAGRGLTFLVGCDTTVTPERGVDPYELIELLSPVEIRGDAVTLGCLPEVPVRLDADLDAATTAGVAESIIGLATRAELPVVPFEGTLPDPSQWWQPVDDELRTVVGLDDRDPVELRLRTANPALPHVLIGGAVGQGKSNLLLVLIHGLAARYAPSDLEMHLLDFKHGLEFSALGPGPDRNVWLPHARVLGVHSDRTFGLAVLRHVTEELARRSDTFKERGVADLSDYPPEPDRPPRILLVLDEFQVMLEDDDDIAEEAARLLERLARLGRAYGVHLVLATQTLDGMSRLATRRGSIFGQVPVRFALKTTAADSQAILREGNRAAGLLRFRGQAILNQNFGGPDDNRQILVTFADKPKLADLRRQLFDKAGPAARPPRIFHVGEPARLLDLAAAPQPAIGSGVAAWAGMPIAVTEQPVTIEARPEPGAGVLVLGDGPADAWGVLSGLALSSALAETGPRPEFLIMDAVAGDPVLDQHRQALTTVLAGLGCGVDVVEGPAKIIDALFELRTRLKEGRIAQPTYLIAYGLHAVPRMAVQVPGTFTSPKDVLQEVVRDGPAGGLITYGWWNRLPVATSQLSYTRADVNAAVFLRHPLDGVRTVCGPRVRWNSEPHRALVWDGINPEPIPVVPFAPLNPDDAEPLVRRWGTS
ncbi:FtsK/SpoIIIE domain-containing protein [Microlunatus sp. GCM10028923]|uniref:FtsK/SpoIIIE domain-containing protein n=1 Tax=Microlunatus sp. GCM10028923 TaxID=3273400 RepID=UPI00361426D4